MFTLIVTTGPSVDSEMLREIHLRGNIIFRLNGAHLDTQNCLIEINRIRNVIPDAKIMIDLPGNKVRLSHLSQPIKLIKGRSFNLHPHHFNFEDFYKFVKVGDTVYANDSIYELEVSNVEGGVITFCSKSNGELTSNKGFQLRGINELLPFLFQRDLNLIELAVKEGVNFISLSFVRSADDVKMAQSILKQHTIAPQLIAKIETALALKNLDSILDITDLINVDRGDLSADIGMVEVPFAIKCILSKAQTKNKKVFLATQFLKYMEKNPIPLLSEIMGLHQVFEMGVTGIQLSEETAVGEYPLECVKIIYQMQERYLELSDHRLVNSGLELLNHNVLS